MKHLLLSAIVTVTVASSAVAGSPTETVIYNFQGGSDGSYPYAGLVKGPRGVLYGTTTEGGGGSCAGGCGTVFQLTPSSTAGGAWVETVLYRFTGGSDGAMPWAGLILDDAGNLYGATTFGGESCGCGVVFKLARPATAGSSWTQSVLYSFKGVRAGDGNGPQAAPVFDQHGNLYGTTYAGGIPCSDSAPTGCGTIYRLSPPAAAGGAWTETVLYRFDPSFAGGPAAPLIADSQGNLYGTAVNDGPYGEGTAYKLSQVSAGDWERTVLHAFGGTSTDGGYVSAGLTPTGGALYGATEGYGGEVGDGGTVFQLTPPASPGGGWTETVLYVFPGDNGDTRGPFGSLVVGPTGILYGMTPSGGGG
ncbi:MAG: choice-of-anchor tandem repeat GloVer-containing protein [Bryobacteraceae bacterium]